MAVSKPPVLAVVARAYELADLLKGGDRITSQDIKRAQTVLKGKSKNEWTIYYRWQYITSCLE